MTTYLLDANVFIQAKNREYGFDFCPGFWQWLDESHRAGTTFSVDSVRDELLKGEDELSYWAHERGADFFLSPDADALISMRAVSDWAMGADYDPAAKNTFLGVADSMLVAQADAGGHVIVTHERADNSRKRIKIPEAAIPLGIKCMSPYQVLSVERARLVLEGAP